MATMYRVVPRQATTCKEFQSAYNLSIYLLGRRVNDYIFIKSDETGDRLVTFTDCDINAIQTTLELA